MKLLVSKIGTALDLGLPSLTRALWYRLGVRTGLNPVRRLAATVVQGVFFDMPVAQGRHLPAAVSTWRTHALWYGFHPVALTADAPPDWHANPLAGSRVMQSLRPWWQIGDFEPQVGDVKGIWEPSRFDWVLAFAQRAAHGDRAALQQLNDWLSDWCRQNPPYLGTNWKCGQEASIRVMHLAMAALILQQAARPQPALLALVAQHLQRIAPTVLYAMAQDNNHGTSEAAALFIGGAWLMQHGHAEGAKWHAQGRYWLAERAGKLIGKQGSFSQYSLSYHRLMLDSYSMVELWRRALSLPGLPSPCASRLASATQWLGIMLAGRSDGPNLGANDGARLLPLTDTGYRDFRPCLQLASVLFLGKSAVVESGPWDDALTWFGLDKPAEQAVFPANITLDDGGYAIMSSGPAWVMLRYPRFRFRPSHADALHVDLWLRGVNVLRDAGSYSYNTAPEWLRYFPGTASHNTVQFDDTDQMPRLSRFLFGSWLRTDGLQPVCEVNGLVKCGAAYRNGQGHHHGRTVTLGADALVVEDTISGFTRHAVLRWHLPPGDWLVTDQGVGSELCRITVTSTVPWQKLALAGGWNSLHYMHKTAVPVLEVVFTQPAVIKTVITWKV